MPKNVIPLQSRQPAAVAEWLRTRPSLAELRAAYPREWQRVEAQVAQLVRQGDPERLTRRLQELSAPVRTSSGRMKDRASLVSETVQRHMLAEALRQASSASQTGVTQGKLRLGKVNGTILQWLLFSEGLRRKAASASLVRLVWPMLSQRERLMPLVTPRGIYCFYSRSLIRGMARLIGDRPSLEIAAGDGVLSGLLGAQGVNITATDDQSWEIDGRQDDVRLIEATRALRKYHPEVVVCCWPPPGNTFERKVFSTPSVQMYILITSRHEAAAGDWAAYRAQDDFDQTEDARLSRAVLPPGSDGVVHVFRRRPSEA